MNRIALICALSACFLMACEPETNSQSAPNPSPNSRADGEMKCVAQGGYLVPSGPIFNCKMPSGQLRDVMTL